MKPKSRRLLLSCVMGYGCLLHGQLLAILPVTFSLVISFISGNILFAAICAKTKETNTADILIKLTTYFMVLY